MRVLRGAGEDWSQTGMRREESLVPGPAPSPGVAAEAHEPDKHERPCRYVARLAIVERRLSILPPGRVRHERKTPWRNGTAHVAFEPIDFIARLAARVPPPRAQVTRSHGIFAPNAKLRAKLMLAGRGRRPAIDAESTSTSRHDRTPEEHRRSMTWAQRRKRVFNVDVTACIHCGGALRIVASIEEPTAIRTILAHCARSGERESMLRLMRYPWTVLHAAGLGWGFDVFDGLLFNLVAPNRVQALLGLPIRSPERRQATLRWTGVLTSALLIGWAVGGIFFGWLCDRIGRTRSLMFIMQPFRRTMAVLRFAGSALRRSAGRDAVACRQLLGSVQFCGT